MKNIFFLFGLFLICNVLLSQNGTYRCNIQRFTDENDPSRNKEHNNSMIITIEVNEITGGSILVTWLDDNTIYKWIVIRKFETYVNEQGSVFNGYYARFSFENVEANKQSIVSIIQDPKTNSLHLAISDPDTKTTNWYHYLTKINY